LYTSTLPRECHIALIAYTMKSPLYKDFNAKLSCSVNKEVAVRFMGDEEATLITFHGAPLAACGIANHSVHPEEEEILVFPWSTFEVTKIHRSASEDAIILRSVDCLVDGLPFSGKYIRDGIDIINQ
jgi:hypothetical protein